MKFIGLTAQDESPFRIQLDLISGYARTRVEQGVYGTMLEVNGKIRIARESVEEIDRLMERALQE